MQASWLGSDVARLARKRWWPLQVVNTVPLVRCLPARLGVALMDSSPALVLMAMTSVLASLRADVVLTLALGIAETG